MISCQLLVLFIVHVILNDVHDRFSKLLGYVK